MHDIIIIGAGPAGLTAAIYARRAGRSVLLIEKETFGGQIVLSPHVENYPFARPMSGTELSDILVEQVMSLGADVEVDKVIGMSANADRTFTVKTEYGEHSARAVIIATGLKHRRMGIENEERFIGRGISFCAVCDGAFFKGKEVAVVGGGNTAVQDAIYLSKLAKKVYLIHRRNELRADKILADRIKSSSVEILWDSVVVGLVADEKLTEIKVKNVKNDSLSAVSVDGLFVAVGQIPNTSFLENADEKPRLTDGGYIVSDEEMRTSVDGVFVAGDVREKSLRQIITACADGAIAANSAIKYLQGLRSV